MHELLVEHYEGRLRVGTTETLSQECVPVLQDAVVLRLYRFVTRRDCDKEVVQVRAATGRASLHELQVIRREDGHAEQAQQIARAREWMAIHAHAISTDSSNLGLQELFTIRLLHGHAHKRCFAARTHESGIRNTTKRVCRRR